MIGICRSLTMRCRRQPLPLPVADGLCFLDVIFSFLTLARRLRLSLSRYAAASLSATHPIAFDVPCNQPFHHSSLSFFGWCSCAALAYFFSSRRSLRTMRRRITSSLEPTADCAFSLFIKSLVFLSHPSAVAQFER